MTARPTGSDIWFFAPSLKRYDTDEFRNSAAPSFVPVSVTGDHCELGCRHCNGQLLKGMYQAPTPDRLWEIATRLKPRGCRGLLLTGGCDRDGIVPFARHCAVLRRVKDELGLKTAVHSKLMDEALADALVSAAPDAVMIDVVGSDETLAEVHRLPHRTVQDVARGIALLEERRLRMAPHIVMGVHHGEMKGEYRALELLEGRHLASLVIVLLTRLRASAMKSASSVPLDDLRACLQAARRRFADTPLLLGCARPMGKAQLAIDMLAIEAGVDGIAYPAEGAVAFARRKGLEPRFSEMCCALMA